MAYSDAVLDHYENPRNVGSFDKSDTDVGTGMVGAPACGDVMKLQIKVDNDTVTLYLGATAQTEYFDQILALKPRRIIFNPGTENPVLVALAAKNGVETLEACTLVLLKTGQY